ncbi:hypothetical protein [Xanthomonas sp. XNM01]|uniref:hypothetical protein n=1 Tax=Xanthomonas sp. XNM01 TaxID=2769289 RepID=UPI00177B1530|nr:hypothetical protein [Xanthomonas sp. XNM01]
MEMEPGMATRRGVLTAMLMLFAAARLVDFVFYGLLLRDLAGAGGFALLAFGHWRQADVATIGGAVLVLGAMLARHVL